ncbi:Embryonic polyadenylate-binding protein [Phytophthora fragariae]|uniref:Polyadenylate-binding protein n=1 Tax=Phytophthora fragariae TaxID=53985 RepID=A0A6A4CUX8_9STRA|nr:Embryonic polyadenylate-binding protein [Phytophthora fragariae]KAE8931437.1 Embryonic polyadenylate-binding protein [Phytophthora fragariae]KAE8995743.1 Embryonic polyadenylate-binding protein [Phytophthora fragariae]KAE9094925.1 Embryonic polyadenylate-binding protein [Phytophthora fragariae]KAE9095318.1 Embryonic polyadenylate-binding protein [Phytophthora fragariae]
MGTFWKRTSLSARKLAAEPAKKRFPPPPTTAMANSATSPTNSPAPAAASAAPAAATSTASTSAASSATGAAQPFHTASLYVGDIHPDVTEALLFEIFNAVGPVASIRVCRDAVTRRSLGYAYVNFHNVADAERALDTMNFTSIKGVPCRIMWSQRDPSLRKSGVGNIFVKNLDTSIDNKALYDTFSLFGNILSCKVAIDHTNGNSKGYGYVHYETAEAATEAIAKINGMLIAGTEVFVGHFQKRQDRPDADDWTNCYVKNIPTMWTDADLLKEFEPFGNVLSAVVMKDNANPEQNRGFGFVNYEDSESAHKAVDALNGKSYPAGEGLETEMYVGKAQKRSERERELRNKFEQLKMERINKYQGVNLYVKNLDDQLTDDELREAFAECGTITSSRVMRDPNGNSRGFGFVCFSTPEEANKTVAEMNGKLISGKPVYVALAQRKEVRRAQLEAQHAQQRAGMVVGRGMPMGQPPMYGAAPMFYGQPGQMPQARQGFMYPQQMMPRGVQRGPIPYGARVPGAPTPGGYPMPGYGMPMQQQRGQPRRGRQGPGPQGPQGAPANRRNFKYTANARNHPARDAPPQGVMPPAAPVQNAGPEPLTSAALAAASPEIQKNMIGERLYPLIHRQQPELAGKITGMLLEMDNGELLHLLESPEALEAKIQEALTVLEAHQG